MDTATLIAIVTSLGIGGILHYLVQETVAWAKGRKGKEDDAWKLHDSEARKRRELEWYAQRLRMLALNHGVPEEDIPPWPDYSSRPDSKQ